LRIPQTPEEAQAMNTQIERELQLPASPDAAWEALTDPEWLQRWLADEVTLDLRPGGDAWFRVGDSIRTGWVEEVSRPCSERGEEGRLVFWWSQDGEPASRVELELTPNEAGGSVLRVVEARPLDVLDLVGIPLQPPGGGTYGPALIAA
jgi:uncharacterized protein YndB with AHSA1/START domain